jgi:hypothetical protein
MRWLTIYSIILAFVFFGCQEESNKIQNIETFAKIYGYARWFHPSDEAKEIDWDRFSVLGVKKVENIRTKSALKDTLLCLFSPIVKGLQLYEVGEQKEQNLDKKAQESSPLKKIVSWQHYGVYLGNKSNIYKSLRTNKPQDNFFSSFTKIIQDVSIFKGKEIKVSGYFKTQLVDSTGFISFYLCPSKMNEGFNDAYCESSKCSIIIKSSEWRKYEIKCKVPKDADFLSWGCVLKKPNGVIGGQF